jgi:hypothetical protein
MHADLGPDGDLAPQEPLTVLRVRRQAPASSSLRRHQRDRLSETSLHVTPMHHGTPVPQHQSVPQDPNCPQRISCLLLRLGHRLDLLVHQQYPVSSKPPPGRPPRSLAFRYLFSILAIHFWSTLCALGARWRSAWLGLVGPAAGIRHDLPGPLKCVHSIFIMDLPLLA